MSLLQNQDFLIHRIRTRYLHTVKDGVGERLITVNPAALNVPAFKNAGWGAAVGEIKRCYSPPIKTGSAAGEYFANSYVAKHTFDETVKPAGGQAGAAVGGLFGNPGVGGGGMGGVGTGDVGSLTALERRDSEDSAAATPTAKPEASSRSSNGPRRIREVREDDDSSDLSDDSDEEDNAQASEKATKIQFDFSKKEIPVRPRAGSSPIRNGPQVLVSSPNFHGHHKTRSRGRIRGGSHGDVDLKPNDYQDILASNVIAQQERIHAEIARKLRSAPGTSPTNGEFDSGDESDASSTMSSDFIDTVDSNPVNNNLVPPTKPVSATSPGVLNALPPPIRPVSQVPPVSQLTLMLKAKEAEADNPMDAYRAFSGKGELTPIYLKLYMPYTKKREPLEIVINRYYKEPEEGGRTRETIMAEAIGFALYKYIEEKREPAIKEELCNINKWTLNMCEDGEADDDFPPLDRTRPITQFISAKAARGRLGGKTEEKMEGEFAMLEASSEQFVENEQKTPFKTPRKSSVTSSHAPSLSPPSGPSGVSAEPPPTLGPSMRQQAVEATSTGTMGITTAAPRLGPSKILRIRLTAVEEFAQSISLCVTTDTYISEVLNQVCRKKHLDARLYVLRVADTSPPVYAPLDRTVASLGTRTDLDLMRRRFVNASEGLGDRPGSPSTTVAPHAPLESLAAGAGRTPAKKSRYLGQPSIWTNPDTAFSRDYLKFTVWRKAPMSIMARHQRVLAIDGEYVHIMPHDSQAAAGKTRSIHISTIIGVKAYRKTPSNFKILVWKGAREQKKYDFEASSAEEADEVVEALRKATQAYRLDHSSLQ